MNPNNVLTPKILAKIIRDQRDHFSHKKLGVERNNLAQFEKLLKSPQILIITGLRRVGKSTLLAQIARKYLKNNYYYLNFEDERLLNFSIQDFNTLYEIFVQEYGDNRVFLLDEIQNVPQWELFVRRLHNQGYKFIITGSNASLLSQELGTRLTGRYFSLELFPFSFKEFVLWSKQRLPNDITRITTKTKLKLQRLAKEYLFLGGIPDFINYRDEYFLPQLYNDVIYRDIATRYNIDNIKSLKELALYLLSNTPSSVSFNKLKELLKLGSVNTVKNYIEYFQNSWLFFTINKYAYSIKEQQIASKKIYCIDNGLVNSLGFSFSPNNGKLLENLVFLTLRKQYSDIYYYKTKDNHEVDFYIPSQNLFIQVAYDIYNPATFQRELASLKTAYQENKNHQPRLLLITLQDEDIVSEPDFNIEIKPLYNFLLSATI